MKIKATVVDLRQGTDAWKQHRATHFNGSELAAAMGLSSYTKRSDLIAQKATGIVPEVDAATQQRFDKGHEYEAIAREWAEEIIGDTLYPCVLAADVEGLPLSASLDGQDLMGEVTWEHKTGRSDLLASLEAGVIPDEYHPQMEQGLMLSGASRCLFMASNGTRESMRFAWYESRPELRAKIVPTWKQFQADVAAYVPSEATAAPAGNAPETLPALRIEVTGTVTASNLAEFKQTALTAIRRVNRDLQTDQDFADAERAVKWCEDVESRLEAAKQHALSQTASIEELFRTIDDISGEARRVRLDLKKLVDARKAAIRVEIVSKAQQALAEHIASLNAEIQPIRLVLEPADFVGAIKNKRTVATLQDAADTTLAQAKIAADLAAKEIRGKLAHYREVAASHEFLFADLQSLIQKPADDFALAVKARIDAHKAAEEAKRQKELNAQLQASAAVAMQKLPEAVAVGAIDPQAAERIGSLVASMAADSAISAAQKASRVAASGPITMLEPLATADEQAHLQLLLEVQELLQHLGGAFDSKFPAHPKPPKSWWDELRASLECLKPRIAAALN
jgi:putative phage-type endonuclease